MKTTREVKREEHNERPQWKCDLAILMGKLVGRRDVEFDLPLEQFIEHLLEKEKETLLERVEGIMKESIGIEKLKDPTDLKKRIQRFAYRCVKNYQKHQCQALSIIRKEKTK